MTELKPTEAPQDEEVKRQLRELKELFDYFDKDKSGSIDSSELVQILRCLGENPVEAEVDDMIAALDKDGNGVIDWTEFSDLMIKRKGTRSIDEELQAVFALFDKEGTMAITKEGIMQTMNEVFKEGMSLEDAEDMVTVIDREGKGYITFDEFKDVMINGI